MSDVLADTRKYLQQLSPHIKARQAAQLLIRLQAELERLQDGLRQTKDGVTVVPNGTRVYYRYPDSRKVYARSYEADLDDPRSHHDSDGTVVWVAIGDCYSTREAAEKKEE